MTTRTTALILNPERHFYCLVLACLLALAAESSRATTVVEMDIEQVAQDAELIFEGEVLSHEVRRAGRSDLIFTFVSFAIEDVIKGEYDAPVLELRFAGGTIGDEIVAVTGLDIPTAGEKGIYFVESLDRNLINPLLGWSQGHFLIDESSGERLILTPERAPVTGVQSMASVPQSLRKQRGLQDGSSDVAAGISVDTSELRLERALSVDEFKARIHSLLEN